jgi:hypothetical protein
VRGLVVAILGAVVLGAWWQRRRRRDDTATAEAPPEQTVQEAPPGESVGADAGPDPAEELRAKLAETRAAEDEQPEPPTATAGEPTPDPEGSPLDPESRRRDVHLRARASIDELK